MCSLRNRSSPQNGRVRELTDVRAAVPDWGPGRPAANPAEFSDLHRVILVEGPSDVAAIQALSARFGRVLQDRRVGLVPMGGATNVRRYVALLGEYGPGVALTGLCDAGEERFFRAVLPAEDVLVCHADLEEELIRALGADGTIAVIEAQGEWSAWQLFRRQPAQRERAVTAQLRRFMGTHSGRKVRYATAMCSAVTADRVPTPLAALLTSAGD